MTTIDPFVAVSYFNLPYSTLPPAAYIRRVFSQLEPLKTKFGPTLQETLARLLPPPGIMNKVIVQVLSSTDPYYV